MAAAKQVMTRILVVNSGSTSLKLDSFLQEGKNLLREHSGRLQKKGDARVFQVDREDSISGAWDTQEAIAFFLKHSGKAPDLVAHRVVHGGTDFRSSCVLTPENISRIEKLRPLAPLHQPPALEAIAACRNLLKGVRMKAVFDTSFHANLPPEAALYAIPPAPRFSEIRRYGFHGLAHECMLQKFSSLSGKPQNDCKIITLQLGGGCSASAIKNGHSVDTSMGFTPLEGLMMGTRSGDIDPGALIYLLQEKGLAPSELDAWLNNHSGLLGVSGISSDMEEVLASQSTNPRARLAVDLFCHRVRKYIGAYLAVLSGADALIFGGGIGENSAEIRRRICERLEVFGLEIDSKQNALHDPRDRRISTENSKLQAWVVSVDEAPLIVRHALEDGE